MTASMAPGTHLFWFSGTGNSLAAARALAAALGEARLMPVTAAQRLPPPPAAVVGVVFPVYAFGLPAAVEHFLETMPLAPDAYLFTVATAARTPGAVHRIAADILTRRGASLAAGWTLRMPGNFAPVNRSFAWGGDGALLDRADARIAGIAEAVREGRRGIREDSMAPLAWIGQRMHHDAQRQLGHTARHFTVGRHCTACGLCATVCPVGNITIEGDAPRWGDRCEACSACLQWCPVGAIRMRGLGANRRRYHHPAIRAQDIAEQAEAAGEESPPAAP